MAEKELFINAVQMIEVDGSWNIPTAVLYEKDGTVAIGSSALAGADFKPKAHFSKSKRGKLICA